MILILKNILQREISPVPKEYKLKVSLSKNPKNRVESVGLTNKVKNMYKKSQVRVKKEINRERDGQIVRRSRNKNKKRHRRMK
jgi:hypothetical protein